MQTQTNRLLLRPFAASDFQASQDARAQRLQTPSTFDQIGGILDCSDIGEFERFVSKHQENSKHGYQYSWGLFLLDGNKLVGDVSLLTLNKQLRWANLGVQLHNQFHGQGYAKEACLAVIAMGFEQLNYHRIESGTELGNTAAIRLINSLGLVEEGVRRKFLPGEDSQDMVFFAANVIDWSSPGSKA